MKTIDIAKSVVNALEDSKGEDILLLDIREITPFADYFVICSGSSNRMISALLDAVVDKVRDDYKLKPRIEGNSDSGWILADYDDIVVHIFSHNKREFYDLESLWEDGNILIHMQ